MFEKVNPGHPDKMADRLAGAVVDLVYERAGGLTKANPRVACEVMAVASGQVVTAICSIGDENVTFVYHAPSAALGDAQASLAPHSLARGFTYPDGYRETERFADIVEQARLYIMTDCGGSFERFAEWGLVRPGAQV